jgi:hypothetical protein
MITYQLTNSAISGAAHTDFNITFIAGTFPSSAQLQAIYESLRLILLLESSMGSHKTNHIEL